MNVVVEVHYSRLLSMKPEPLTAWKNNWDNDILFVEDDLVWKQTYTELLEGTSQGVPVDIKQTLIKCKELI